MPVYNASKFLKKSISSVFNQTLDDIELICIDDGSKDNSLEVLNQLQNEFKNLKIIEQENQGPANARNNGIKNANGEYIAFLDADDIYIDENALEEMYEFGKKNDANVVAANLKFIEPDYTIVDNPHYPAKDYACFEDYAEIDSKDYGIPYAFYKNIYKKEFLMSNDIMFPDIVPGEDPIFLANVFVNVKSIFVVPFTLYGYNHSIGGGVNKKIDTYEKKNVYIKHFKTVSEILKNGGLKHTSDFYKIHLFRYLNFEKNNNDPEIFEIYNNIFGIDCEEFDKTDFNFTKFNIAIKFYFMNKFNSENFYKQVNKEFLGIDIYHTPAMTEDIIDKYFLVIYSYSFNDFKLNYENYLSNNLKFKDNFFKFKVEKYVFNLDIRPSIIVFNTLKLILLNNSFIEINNISKELLRKCYKVIQYNSLDQYLIN